MVYKKYKLFLCNVLFNSKLYNETIMAHNLKIEKKKYKSCLGVSILLIEFQNRIVSIVTSVNTPACF